MFVVIGTTTVTAIIMSDHVLIVYCVNWPNIWDLAC